MGRVMGLGVGGKSLILKGKPQLLRFFLFRVTIYENTEGDNETQ